MTDRRRNPDLGGLIAPRRTGARPRLGDCDVVRIQDLAHGLALAGTEHFDGVYVDTRDPSVRQWAGNLIQSERILEALPDGVAVVNADLRIVWANATFEELVRRGGQGSQFLRRPRLARDPRARLQPLPHRPGRQDRHHPPALPRQPLSRTARHADLRLRTARSGSSSAWPATSRRRCSSSRSSTPCTRPGRSWPPWPRISWPR